MARRKGQFLSGLGTMFEIWKALVEAVIAKGGTDDDMRRIISDRGLAGKIANLVVAKSAKSVTYDQSVGLAKIIERAVGRENLGNISPDITQERFLLKGTGVRKVLCRVEAYLDGEMGEQAAKRLLAAGHVLASTGDLAGFLHDHPEEVAEWGWVDAISEDSRWTCPVGPVLVPCAHVGGADRYFRLRDFRNQHGSHGGVLVLCE